MLKPIPTSLLFILLLQKLSFRTNGVPSNLWCKCIREQFKDDTDSPFKKFKQESATPRKKTNTFEYAYLSIYPISCKGYTYLRKAASTDYFYRVFIKYCVFPRILEILPPLPLQHSAAIGCTENY